MSISKECQGRRKKLEYCLGGTFFLGKSTGACFVFYPIPVSAWIYGWFCEWYHCCTMRFSLRFVYIPVVDLVLFFPLTLVLIEVKKQFHSSSAAVCFPPFGYYLVCRGGSDVYFSNILRSLCLLFCVLSQSSLVLLLTRRVRDSFDGTLVTSLAMC